MRILHSGGLWSIGRCEGLSAKVFSILQRLLSGKAPEVGDEAAGIRETAAFGNFGDRLPRRPQQIFGCCNPAAQ